MAKKPCVICGNELGMLNPKVQLTDGVICYSCLNGAGIATLTNTRYLTTASVTSFVYQRRIVAEAFKPSKVVGTYMKIDETNQTFMVGKDLFEYSSLLDFELLEDGHSITKGGLGRAVAGGVLFGGVGAVVGGITGHKKTKGVCTSMKIRLSLKNAQTDTVYINFILSETKTNGFIYKAAQDSAQHCISALQMIIDAVQSSSSPSTTSEADEIMKFKQLADSGVITQEEFEAKKKQILGL